MVDIEDKCRGAALMGNIAELIIRYRVKNEQSSEAIFQAESWAKKGLDLVSAARKVSPSKCEACEEAYAVLLYNLAMIRDVRYSCRPLFVLLTDCSPCAAHRG